MRTLGPRDCEEGTLNRNTAMCVFCGSSDRVGARYLQAATQLGQALGDRGYSLVYGGGATGLMGRISEAALQSGAQVIGVIPEIFNTEGRAQRGLSELHVVRDMHTRKAMMAELSDAFIALPVGFGTFEELFEILTWAQIGLHSRPIGLLDVDGYFYPCIALINQVREEGVIHVELSDFFMLHSYHIAFLDRLREFHPPLRLLDLA